MRHAIRFLHWLRRVLDGCQHQHTLLAILPEGLTVRCTDCNSVTLLPIDRPRYRYRFEADLTHPVVGMLQQKAIAQQERARREKVLWSRWWRSGGLKDGWAADGSRGPEMRGR